MWVGRQAGLDLGVAGRCDVQGKRSLMQKVVQSLLHPLHEQVGGMLLADKLLQSGRHQGAKASVQVLHHGRFQFALLHVPLQGLLDEGLMLHRPSLRRFKLALLIGLLADLFGFFVGLIQHQSGLLVKALAGLVGLVQG